MVTERSSSTPQVWFRTDEAWDFLPSPLGPEVPVYDVREEARGLRFISSAARIEDFVTRHQRDFQPFTLSGSGDFHHLSGIWIRQFTEPFWLLSFDNHPDWDVRPPYWSCGAWINRALENPLVQGVSIWGCDNFECNWPGRLLGNRTAAKAGKLLVQPWRKEGVTYPDWLHPIEAASWKAAFSDWVAARAGQRIYITIDLDCLTPTDAITNWEQGRFTRGDLLWALQTVHEKAQVMGGDLCGGWSPQLYQTNFQKLAGWFDHPTLTPPTRENLATTNGAILQSLWPALIGR